MKRGGPEDASFSSHGAVNRTQRHRRRGGGDLVFISGGRAAYTLQSLRPELHRTGDKTPEMVLD